MLIIVVLSSFISSASIGISPADVYFKNVLRGGYSERTLTITIDSDKPIKMSASPRGEIEDWISFEEEFEVSKNNPYYLKMSIQPPIDMPNGNYSGFLRITASGDSKTAPGKATGIVNAALDLYAEVEVTDTEYTLCRAWDFNVESAEKGDDILFNLRIYNQGNVRLYPTIKISIWDRDRINKVKEVEFSNEMIIPTTEKEIIIPVESHDLEIGQYWAEVSSIECYSSETLTFDVLEEGALKSHGVLLSVSSPPWINVGETTLIEAIFENTGEKTVSARFRGEITLGNKIVQILESETSSVKIGERETFKFYFTPTSEGKYIVNGFVFYDGKKTFEKGTVINVNRTGINWNKIKIYIVYLGLIVAISYLGYRINKERLKNKKRGKKIK